jgi:hypothetical protein
MNGIEPVSRFFPGEQVAMASTVLLDVIVNERARADDGLVVFLVIGRLYVPDNPAWAIKVSMFIFSFHDAIEHGSGAV